MTLRILGGLVCSVFPLITLSAAIDDEKPSVPSDLTLTFEVRMITVEAQVTDKQGNPVTGLTRDDFLLLVDDRQVNIDHFSERDILLGESSGEEAESSDAEALPAISSVDTDSLRDAPLYKGTSYLVFLDDYFTTRYYRRPIIEKMIEDLAYLGPDDRMAIVRYNGRQLEVVADWSGDRADLEQSFETALKMKTGELVRESRLKVTANVEARYRALTDQVDRTARAVAIAMRSFSNSAGRKMLLLVSNGWGSPNVTVPLDVPSAWASGRPRGFAIETVVDAANQIGYTVYPMVLTQPTLPVNAEDRAPASSADLFNDTQAYHKLVNAFDRIAYDTGGRLIPRAFVQKEPLRTVVNDAASYYVLGFQSTSEVAGRHKIRVRLTRPDLTVRHRRNFRLLNSKDQAEMALEASLLLGSSGPGLDISLGEPGRHKMRQVKVPIQVKIPMDWVTMLPLGDDHYACKLELRISAEDDHGNRADIAMVPVTLQGGPPPEGSYTSYEAELLLRRREQRLVFSLLDTGSGETLTQTVAFNP